MEIARGTYINIQQFSDSIIFLKDFCGYIFHPSRYRNIYKQWNKTKDILHVKQLLGHRNINSTPIYRQLVALENPEEYTCGVAKDLKEDQELIEAGFEYVTERDGLKIYRKRK